MTAYAIFEVSPNSEATPEQKRNYELYKSRVPEIIANHGGRYLVRGGTGLSLNGATPAPRWHLIEFPSSEHVAKFWNSEEYLAIKYLREGAATVRVVVVS